MQGPSGAQPAEVTGVDDAELEPCTPDAGLSEDHAWRIRVRFHPLLPAVIWNCLVVPFSNLRNELLIGSCPSEQFSVVSPVSAHAAESVCTHSTLVRASAPEHPVLLDQKTALVHKMVLHPQDLPDGSFVFLIPGALSLQKALGAFSVSPAAHQLTVACKVCSELLFLYSQHLLPDWVSLVRLACLRSV